MSRFITVRTTAPAAGYPTGAELGFRDEASARSVLGTAFVVIRDSEGNHVAPVSPPEETALADMTRDDLNAEAARRGIENAASLPNKDAVIAAIEGGPAQ